MAALIDEIVRRSGLSRPTVLHVLGTRGHLYSEKTRTRILQIAEELGHRPNAAARAISTGRFRAIGLLASTNIQLAVVPFDVLWGMQQALSERDLHLVMGQVPDTKLVNHSELPRVLREWSVDGLIISYTDQYPPQMLELIRRYEIPSVWLNAKLDADCVYPDDFGAGRIATECLLAKGHRRIAYCTRWSFSHYSVADRFAGYCAAMRAAGLEPIDRRMPASTSEDPVLRRAHLQAVLTGPDRPTAVVTYGLNDAESLVATAWRLGMRIPDDLSLVGIGQERSMAAMDVTMVRIDAAELGRQAVAAALKKIEQPAVLLEPVAAPPALVEGETTAPPR